MAGSIDQTDHPRFVVVDERTGQELVGVATHGLQYVVDHLPGVPRVGDYLQHCGGIYQVVGVLWPTIRGARVEITVRACA